QDPHDLPPGILRVRQRARLPQRGLDLVFRPPGSVPGRGALIMQKTYHGSCHCGAVRFACEIDLAKGTSKCNCSACGKGRFWKAIVMAPSFRLLQGQEALSEYQFGPHTLPH